VGAETCSSLYVLCILSHQLHFLESVLIVETYILKLKKLV